MEPSPSPPGSSCERVARERGRPRGAVPDRDPGSRGRSVGRGRRSSRRRCDEPFPDGPSDAGDVLALLDEVGSPATMGIAGPRFFGFVIGGVAARRAGRELARDGVGSERGLPLAVPGRLGARGGRARVDARHLRAARRAPAGAFVTGATMANFSALAAARHAVLAAPGLGRRGRRAVRRAADHGRDRRGGAPDADQGARPPRLRAQPPACACPSTGRAACAPTRCPSSRRPTIVCVQAGNVNTGRVRPAGGDRGAHAGGRRLGARRRRVRAVGGRRRRAAPTSPRASASPTRGRPTPTSGSTSPTTAASRSCATPARCAPRWP